jgi:hypothetical protein
MQSPSGPRYGLCARLWGIRESWINGATDEKPASRFQSPWHSRIAILLAPVANMGPPYAGVSIFVPDLIIS